MSKTKVFIEEFKGHNLFTIWAVDSTGKKTQDYPIVSVGLSKANALVQHLDDLKFFADRVISHRGLDDALFTRIDALFKEHDLQRKKLTK